MWWTAFATEFLLRTVCDAFNNANGKIVNIMCNGNAVPNDLTGKIVCDVPFNGNVFLLERLCGMYIQTETFSGDWLCGMYLRPETISPYNCIFSSTLRISVFECSPVAHDLILPSVCARRAYPRRFLGRVGRPPYRTHSLGDSSKWCLGKGLKTICLGPAGTSVCY